MSQEICQHEYPMLMPEPGSAGHLAACHFAFTGGKGE
jgi:hypothetical protein